MKTILVPVDETDSMESVLQCAALFAARFGSCIEGLPLRPLFNEIIAPDPIVAVPLPPASWNDAEFSAIARERFMAFCREKGLAAGDGPADAARAKWRQDAAVDDGALGALARVFDLSVLGRPGTSPLAPRMNTIEAVLFDGGRPVLMAPPKAPKAMGDNILIAWNQSTETARATAMAMPLLRQAKKVTVLTVEGETVPGPAGAELARCLVANGIAATAVDAPAGRRKGETILAMAGQRNIDLIIKGAYTTSRLRQMIFGGSTSHLLSSATLPVFMAA